MYRYTQYAKRYNDIILQYEGDLISEDFTSPTVPHRGDIVTGNVNLKRSSTTFPYWTKDRGLYFNGESKLIIKDSVNIPTHNEEENLMSYSFGIRIWVMMTNLTSS